MAVAVTVSAFGPDGTMAAAALSLSEVLEIGNPGGCCTNDTLSQHHMSLPYYNASLDASDDFFNNTSLPIDMQFNDGHILQISCYSSIFVVSLIGNLCVLKAILGGGRKQRKSRVNLMLLHLAIADLIVSINKHGFFKCYCYILCVISSLAFVWFRNLSANHRHLLCLQCHFQIDLIREVGMWTHLNTL